MALKEDLLQLIRSDPQARDMLRRELLTVNELAIPDQLAALTAAQARTGDHLETLAAAQARTETRMDSLARRMEELAAAQARTEIRMDALIRVVEGMALELHGLSQWRRGEQGRREGERYERNTVRHAYVIFGGGQNVSQRPERLEHLERALEPVHAAETLLDEVDDPFLADLLWWKGDRVAVVEISRQVDASDIERAARRAATLRGVGVSAMGVVIGRDWASEDAEQAAKESVVEWRVADDSSPGYLEFRKGPQPLPRTVGD